jgi:hypothetical protein
VPDRHRPGKAAEDVFVEDLADETHVLMHTDLGAVRHCDAGGLLAAVLESEEGEKGHASGFLARRVQSDDTALFLGPIVVMGKADHVGLWHPSGQR